MQKKVFVKTFGCQMNEYDSNRIYNTLKNIWQYTKEKAGNGYHVMRNSIRGIYTKCQKVNKE